jgi:hypothetical protein
MLKPIWKQELKITGEQFVELPQGLELLTVQIQNGSPQLWFKCDPNTPKILRRIRIYGTGVPVSLADEQYLATFQIADGQLVFHVFVGV